MFLNIKLKYFLLAPIFFVSTYSFAQPDCDVFFNDMVRNFTERLESNPNNENFLEQKKLATASLSKYKIANKSVINEVDDLCSEYTQGSGINHVNFYILTRASEILKVNN